MKNSLINERKKISRELIKKYGFEIKKNVYLISVRDLSFYINNHWKIDFFSNSKTNKFIREREGKFYVKEEDLFNFNGVIKGIECSNIDFHKTKLSCEYILYTRYVE